MKITRYQKEISSTCECGKPSPKKEKASLKNKVYDTRSGLNRKQDDIFNGHKKRIDINELKLRNKTILHNMNASIELPIVNNGLKSCDPLCDSFHNELCDKKLSLDITPTIPTNICDYGSLIRNGKRKSLPDDTLTKGINSKLKIELSDQQHSPTNEDNAVVINGCLHSPSSKLKNEVYENGKLDTSTYINGHNDDAENKSKAVVKSENLRLDIHITDIKKVQENGFGDNSNQKLKRKSGKRSNFEVLFLREQCEKLKLSSIPLKRVRNIKSYCSPKKNLLSSTESKEHSQLTHSGIPIPKRKTGRKSKVKEPIYHYLDMFMKKQDKDHEVEKTDNEMISVKSDVDAKVEGSASQFGTSNKLDITSQDKQCDSCQLYIGSMPIDEKLCLSKNKISCSLTEMFNQHKRSESTEVLRLCILRKYVLNAENSSFNTYLVQSARTILTFSVVCSLFHHFLHHTVLVHHIMSVIN